MVGPGEARGVQVVGYDRLDPALLVATDGTVRRESLEAGAELRYTLGRRRCAGVLEGDRHRPCDRPVAPYCDAHETTWVCARCTGTCLKDEMDCHVAHAIYLAAFAPAVHKVGVTRLDRLPDRLREQGADRAAHLRTVTNGRIAREIEADLAAEFPDRVRVSTKVAGLGRAVDDDAWERALTPFEVIDTYDPDYDLEVTATPVPETVATGTVLGAKGRLILLERSGTPYAVDMRDLVGYDLEPRPSERDRQSSLGAFG